MQALVACGGPPEAKTGASELPRYATGPEHAASRPDLLANSPGRRISPARVESGPQLAGPLCHRQAGAPRAAGAGRHSEAPASRWVRQQRVAGRGGATCAYATGAMHCRAALRLLHGGTAARATRHATRLAAYVQQASSYSPVSHWRAPRLAHSRSSHSASTCVKAAGRSAGGGVGASPLVRGKPRCRQAHARYGSGSHSNGRQHQRRRRQRRPE